MQNSGISVANMLKIPQFCSKPSTNAAIINHLFLCLSAPPRFTRTPSDFRVPVHGSIELECAASGDPLPVISWHRNSVQVIPNQRTFINEEGDLAVYSVTFRDEGLYECVAENTVGVSRAYARVTVLGKGSDDDVNKPRLSQYDADVSSIGPVPVRIWPIMTSFCQWSHIILQLCPKWTPTMCFQSLIMFWLKVVS